MEINTSFFKGINRAVSRDEFFDPDFFWSTFNARLLQTGRIGEVVRIKGYESITGALDDLDVLYDMVRVDNNFAVFYKTTDVAGDQYCVKLFDDTATLIDTFTYRSDIVPEWGELKQYDDSLFIAPHNKIVYEFKGSFTMNDFISNVTHIEDIDVDIQNATKAQYNLTINETLSGFQGVRAAGYVWVLRNNIPQGVEVTFNIKVGDDVSDPIGPFTSSDTKQAIRNAIIDGINNSASLNTNWEASADGFRVIIRHLQTGSANNEVPISVIGSDQIKVTDDSDGLSFGDPTWVPNYGDPVVGRNGITFVPMNYDYNEALGNTFSVRETRGGSDDDTISGSVRVTLKDAVVTDSIRIVETDTVEDIASKLFDVLTNSASATENYTFTLIENPSTPTTIDTINIEAKKEGKKYNTDIFLEINADGNVPIDLPDGFVTIDQVVSGRDENETGTLTPFTNYWYAARLKFIDGHITNVCSPRRIRSEANGLISVVFNVEQSDLDDTYPRLQVFRKEEGEDFFLIEEVNLNVSQDLHGFIDADSFEYVDDGKPNLEAFVETIPFWTKTHKTQEVVENRYVQANTTQFNEFYEVQPSDFTLATEDVASQVDTELERDIAPYNSRCYVYVRPQYTDGTLGFFKEIGTVEIDNSSPQKISVTQNALVEGIEKQVNDLRFYGRYLPFGEEQNYPFNAAEIQTPNLPSLADPTVNPTRTKVFFGYKYMVVTDNGTKEFVYTFARGWDVGAENTGDHYRYIGKVGNNRSIRKDVDRLVVNVHGTSQTYIPVATYDRTGGSTNYTDTVYKLEVFDALEDATSTGNLEVRLNRSNVRGGLSQNGGVSDDDLFGLRVRVASLEDKTLGSESFDIQPDGTGLVAGFDIARITPPLDCRIYLVLDDSLLDEIDNQNVNVSGVIRNRFEAAGREDSVGAAVRLPRVSISGPARIAFELVNFQEESQAVFDLNDTNTIKLSGGKDYEKLINVTPARYTLINRDLSNDQQVIYFGRKDNELSAFSTIFDTTGFRFNRRGSLSYSRLAPYNIYDTLIRESDFNFNRLDFENQIIWSNPLLQNNYFSGGRNFTLENFYNVPTENGEIIELVSLSGSLYVFCERGVARLLIGETLTQQRNGQVFVDSSGFITKHLWMLENTSPIKKQSIIKKDGAIYFTDGNDVYRVGQTVENISQGVLNLNESVDYFASVVSLYDEYRLCDPAGEMFVYNMKYDTWYGPHTYTPEKTVEVEGNIYSYEDGLIREDVGNTFGGTPYDSVLESVGNDTEIGAIDKTYRKFYMDVEGDATFSYGKTFDTNEAVDLTQARKKNGYYNVGIKGSEGNTKKIYWKLISQDEDFALKGFRTAYNLRRRR